MALLVSFNEHNRIVHFSGSSMSDLVVAVKAAFIDIFDKTAQLVLQLKDESWGGAYIDVQDIESIKDRSVLRVFLEKKQSEEVTLYPFMWTH